MDTLRETLRHAMESYAGRGLNVYSYLLSNPDQDVFAVISIAQVRDQRQADAGLIARIVDGRIVVELDLNNKPLVQDGIPRDRIILAYAGESIPEAA